jgi:hypothetical protein
MRGLIMENPLSSSHQRLLSLAADVIELESDHSSVTEYYIHCPKCRAVCVNLFLTIDTSRKYSAVSCLCKNCRNTIDVFDSRRDGYDAICILSGLSHKESFWDEPTLIYSGSIVCSLHYHISRQERLEISAQFNCNERDLFDWIQIESASINSHERTIVWEMETA